MYSDSREMSQVEEHFIRSVIQVSAVVGEPLALGNHTTPTTARSKYLTKKQQAFSGFH